jgi:hypothetical protein
MKKSLILITFVHKKQLLEKIRYKVGFESSALVLMSRVMI